MTSASNPTSPAHATQQAAPPLRRVDQLLAHCGESPTQPTNELIHFVAIPLIMLSLVSMIHLMDAAGVLLATSVAVFVVAWIFQFIGHKIEGKKPSFIEDIQYLWVGPLFVLSKLFVKLGIRW